MYGVFVWEKLVVGAFRQDRGAFDLSLGGAAVEWAPCFLFFNIDYEC